MNSPFIYGKIASGESFTDRGTEQKRLSDNITCRINSILISPRRWGKSSLVAKVEQSLQNNKSSLRFCFLDLFNVRSEQEFYAHFALVCETWTDRQYVQQVVAQIPWGHSGF